MTKCYKPPVQYKRMQYKRRRINVNRVQYKRRDAMSNLHQIYHKLELIY